MSTVVYTATSGTPAQFTGSCPSGSVLSHLTFLVVTVGSPCGRIKDTSANGAIKVTQAQFNFLNDPGLTFPCAITLDGTDASGIFTVSAVHLPGGLAPAIHRMESDVHELAGTAAAIDERLAHDLSGDIVGELRKLNRRVEAIERLLIEARNLQGLAPTGSDRR